MRVPSQFHGSYWDARKQPGTHVTRTLRLVLVIPLPASNLKFLSRSVARQSMIAA